MRANSNIRRQKRYSILILWYMENIKKPASRKGDPKIYILVVKIKIDQ